MNNKSDNHIQIFDTTLRDGQQCPGAGMSFAQNIEYARLACELRIDIIEAGFPSASNQDFKIVRTIAEEMIGREYQPIVAGLCQMREPQVIRTIEALNPLIPLKKARVHVYLPVDPELMSASLGQLSTDKKQIISDLYKLVKIAADAGCEVEFSPEGYSRMGNNFDFVTEAIRAAVEAGATVINCPDTIGGACQIEGEDYFVRRMNKHADIISKEFPGKKVTWSVHCHNDFGLAVQNSINAVFQGPARQLEGCINGIGERAGNAAIEQCVMLIKQFGAKANPENPYYTTIATEKLQKASDFVAKYMLPRQPHWPVTGENATKHTAGGHTNAILKNPLAYQPFDPKETGKEISFAFGPLSGSNHAQAIIEGFGYVCAETEKTQIAQFIKDYYSERRKGVTDGELMQAYFEHRKPMHVESIEYSKSAGKAKVIMRGKFLGYEGVVEEENPGPDSALAAARNFLEKKFGPIKILHHESRSESVGIDAQSISRIFIADQEGKQFEGIGTDQDIEISAIRALIDAVNRSYVDKHFSMNENQNETTGENKAPFVS